MSHWQLQTPITFIIFNRPDTTAKVFEAIREIKPPKLFVIADGPRNNKLHDVEKCHNTRLIIEQVDWDCEVVKNYSDINLGCQMRVSSGLKWVFSHVEETIILEDDCLPHPSFFRYCEELLTKYKCDYRIMSIAGVNFQQDQQETEYSYYFSQFHDCWGWATWKRAWQHFDFEMKLWSKIKNSGLLKDKLFDRRMFKHWDYEFSSTYNGRINSWYYRWLFSCWMQSGLGIFPSVNLVSNIGFSKDATHTIIKRSYSDLPTEAIDFPIKHPPFILRDIEADKLTQRTRFNTPISIRLQAKLQKIINDCILK